MTPWRVLRPELPAHSLRSPDAMAAYRAISQALSLPRPPGQLADGVREVLAQHLGIETAVLVIRDELERLGPWLGTPPDGLVGLPMSVIDDALSGELALLERDSTRVVCVRVSRRCVLVGRAPGSPESLSVLARVAPALGLALRAAELVEDRRLDERLDRALRLAARATGRPPAERWQLLARLARRILGADVSVEVRERLGETLAVASLVGDPVVLERELALGRGIAGWVVRERRSVVVGSSSQGVTDPAGAAVELRGSGEAESALVVPLVGEAGVLGVVAAFHAMPMRFGGRERTALEQLARVVVLWEAEVRSRHAAGGLNAAQRLAVFRGLGMEVTVEAASRRWRFGEVSRHDARAEEVVLGPEARIVVRGSAELREGAVTSLREGADRDPLTGVLHRQAFLARAEAVVEGLAARGRACVILVDVDRLAEINAREGTVAGDRELVRVAAALLAAAPPRALVGRLGGDEFAILLALEEGVSSARHARLQVAEALERHRVSVSLGSALIEAGGDVREGLARAEGELLADEQRRGVARLERVGSAVDATSVQLAPELARALEGDQRGGVVFAALQPLVELESRRVVGVEALARWDHPRRGLVSPALFLPVAVQLRLVDRLDEVVRRAALADVGWLAQRGLGDDLRVSFNLSAASALERGVAGRLTELVEQSGVAPGRVVVELTESEISTSMLERIRRTLDALRRHGLAVALDDFGVGTSSLRHLASLPVDEIKIDQAFVRQVTSREGARLIEGIVALARRLGVAVVAEGVEDDASARRLFELGVAYGQGFHFARPMRAAELERWLRRGRGRRR